MTEVRFEHKILGGGRFHVITSPDIKGLHVTADTREAAELEALKVVSLIVKQRDAAARLTSVAFEAA